jgi:hypothetical protein
MLGSIGDAIGKINMAYPDYLDEEKIYEITGL